MKKKNKIKIIAVFLLIIAIILIIVGFKLWNFIIEKESSYIKIDSSDKVSNIIDNVFSNMESLDSYKEISSTTFLQVVDGLNYSTTINKTTLFNFDQGIYYYEFNNNVDGVESIEKYYKFFEDDESTVFSYKDYTWDVDNSIVFDKEGLYNEFLVHFNNDNTEVAEIDDSKIRLTAKVKLSDFEQFYMFDGIEDDATMELVIDDNFVKKISANISYLDEKLSFSYEYFDLNNTEIELPEEINIK